MTYNLSARSKRRATGAASYRTNAFCWHAAYYLIDSRFNCWQPEVCVVLREQRVVFCPNTAKGSRTLRPRAITHIHDVTDLYASSYLGEALRQKADELACAPGVAQVYGLAQ